jgi:hypothetical protein
VTAEVDELGQRGAPPPQPNGRICEYRGASLFVLSGLRELWRSPFPRKGRTISKKVENHAHAVALHLK